MSRRRAESGVALDRTQGHHNTCTNCGSCRRDRYSSEVNLLAFRPFCRSSRSFSTTQQLSRSAGIQLSVHMPSVSHGNYGGRGWGNELSRPSHPPSTDTCRIRTVLFRNCLLAAALVLLTTTYSSAQINPISIGRTNSGVDSPFCYVDGITGTGHTPSIEACIAYLNNLGVTGAGTIYSTIPEDITSQIFYPASFPPFSGTIFLNNDIGTWLAHLYVKVGTARSAVTVFFCRRRTPTPREFDLVFRAPVRSKVSL